MKHFALQQSLSFFSQVEDWLDWKGCELYFFYIFICLFKHNLVCIITKRCIIFWHEFERQSRNCSQPSIVCKSVNVFIVLKCWGSWQKEWEISYMRRLPQVWSYFSPSQILCFNMKHEFATLNCIMMFGWWDTMAL